jgi:hypothetical protein
MSWILIKELQVKDNSIFLELQKENNIILIQLLDFRFANYKL